MWIKFQAEAPFAVKIFVGGINAVSGEPSTETPATLLRRLTLLSDHKSVQDYVVPPKQLWLDGIASNDGKVRQFVAMPFGTGHTVEAQISGKDVLGGLQFHVIPSVREPSPGPFRHFHGLRGVGGPEKKTIELGIAPGGRIKQTIVADTYPSDSWEPERSISFNVQILNSELFHQFTGQAPPPTPITAQTYADNGLPFFKLYEEKSGIQGDFKDVKSVKEMDNAKDKTKVGENREADEPAISNPIIVLNPDGAVKAGFKPVAVMTEELRKLNLARFSE